MRHLAGTARPYVAVRVALKSSAKNTKDYISVNTNGKTKNINWTFNWTWQTSQFVNHNSLPTRNLQSFLSTLPISPCLSLPAASTCCDRSVVRSCSKDWIRWKSCLHQNMWAESQRSWGMLGDVWKQWKQPSVGERLNFGQIMSKFWNITWHHWHHLTPHGLSPFHLGPPGLFTRRRASTFHRVTCHWEVHRSAQCNKPGQPPRILSGM